MNEHLIIPDTQCKPGDDFKFLRRIGQYILEKRPQVVVHLGDHWDMESLSSYDRGKKCFEGRRYKRDIEAGNNGLSALMEPLHAYNRMRRKNGKRQYKPRLVMIRGNHEERIERAIESDAILEGTIGYEDFNDKEHGWEVHDFLKPVTIDGVCYCLASHHKILTRDLRYIPLAEVEVGQEILAFDEDQPAPRCGRRYRTATVEAVGTDIRDLFEVELDGGKTFLATEDHLWLARRYGSTGWEWVRTDELIVGSSQACQVAPEWEPVETYDAGWLAGMFDGEGHISKPNCKQGGIQVGIAQKCGPILDKILSGLEALGVAHKIAMIGGNGKDVANIRIHGPSADKLKLLGMIRPSRIINKFRPEMLGRVQKLDGYGKSVVTAVRPAGRGEIVKIKTSTGTMIVEGYAHHNCHYFYNPNSGKPFGGTAHTKLKNVGCTFTMGHQQGLDVAYRTLPNGQKQIGIVAGSAYEHDEAYKGPQANHHWRGIVYKHEVRNGWFDPMFVSLDYLKRKYR